MLKFIKRIYNKYLIVPIKIRKLEERQARSMREIEIARITRKKIPTTAQERLVALDKMIQNLRDSCIAPD